MMAQTFLVGLVSACISRGNPKAEISLNSIKSKFEDFSWIILPLGF